MTIKTSISMLYGIWAFAIISLGGVALVQLYKIEVQYLNKEKKRK